MKMFYFKYFPLQLIFWQDRESSAEETISTVIDNGFVHTATGSSYSRMFKKVGSLQTNVSTGNSSQIEVYLTERKHFMTAAVDRDPYMFWLSKKTQFSDLYLLALDVLSIPATSAHVERAFSQAGLCATNS